MRRLCVGPATALAFRSTIDDPKCLKSSSDVVAFGELEDLEFDPTAWCQSKISTPRLRFAPFQDRLLNTITFETKAFTSRT